MLGGGCDYRENRMRSGIFDGYGMVFVGFSAWSGHPCDAVGPAGCVVRASERISVLVTIKTNQSVAKHAADDGQHVCRLYTHFTASTGALLTGPTEVLPF